MISYELDSLDEIYFYKWLLELQSKKIVTELQQVRVQIPIAKKKTISVGKKEITLIKDKFYTPDFIFKISDKYCLDLNNPVNTDYLFIKSLDGFVYVDVKGSYKKHYSTMTFADRQAMCFDLNNIYVNKIIPFENKEKSKCLFAITFVPEYVINISAYKLKSKLNQNKIKFKINTVKEWTTNL